MSGSLLQQKHQGMLKANWVRRLQQVIAERRREVPDVVCGQEAAVEKGLRELEGILSHLTTPAIREAEWLRIRGCLEALQALGPLETAPHLLHDFSMGCNFDLVFSCCLDEAPCLPLDAQSHLTWVLLHLSLLFQANLGQKTFEKLFDFAVRATWTLTSPDLLPIVTANSLFNSRGHLLLTDFLTPERLGFLENLLSCALEPGCGVLPQHALFLTHHVFSMSSRCPALTHEPFQSRLEAVLALLIKHNARAEDPDDAELAFKTLVEFMAAKLVPNPLGRFPQDDLERLAGRLDLGSADDGVFRASAELAALFVEQDSLTFQNMVLIFGQKIVDSAGRGLRRQTPDRQCLIIEVCRLFVKCKSSLFNQIVELRGLPGQMVAMLPTADAPHLRLNILEFVLVYLEDTRDTEGELWRRSLALIDALVSGFRRMDPSSLVLVLQIIVQLVSYHARADAHRPLIAHLQRDQTCTLFLVHANSCRDPRLKAALTSFVELINEYLTP